MSAYHPTADEELALAEECPVCGSLPRMWCWTVSHRNRPKKLHDVRARLAVQALRRLNAWAVLNDPAGLSGI